MHLLVFNISRAGEFLSREGTPRGNHESCGHLECTWSPVTGTIPALLTQKSMNPGAPMNPGAAPAVGLAPIHPSVPVSPVCPMVKLVGTDTKSFPSSAQGGKGKASPCQVQLQPDLHPGHKGWKHSQDPQSTPLPSPYKEDGATVGWVFPHLMDDKVPFHHSGPLSTIKSLTLDQGILSNICTSPFSHNSSSKQPRAVSIPMLPQHPRTHLP